MSYAAASWDPGQEPPCNGGIHVADKGTAAGQSALTGKNLNQRRKHMARATAHPNKELISSEDVNGTTVYGSDGKKIGEIDHLMIDKMSGRVAYAVISFGGFLGLGHSHYPVPWGALKYDTTLGGFRTNITEQQLKDAPEFSDDSWGDRDWEVRTHRHYTAPHYWELGPRA
jgi:sporulation protein YlmC with PRC-barrel domain